MGHADLEVDVILPVNRLFGVRGVLVAHFAVLCVVGDTNILLKRRKGAGVGLDEVIFVDGVGAVADGLEEGLLLLEAGVGLLHGRACVVGFVVGAVAAAVQDDGQILRGIATALAADANPADTGVLEMGEVGDVLGNNFVQITLGIGVTGGTG